MTERFPNLSVLKFSASEWKEFSEKAHLIVFDQKRNPQMDRIDYALVVSEGDSLQGYLTAREFDSESVYWQYGGSFPTTKKNLRAFYCYQKCIDWTKEQGYKRITTLIENENVNYIKLAMKFGFRAIGIRMFEGNILIEFLNDLMKEVSLVEQSAS